MAGRNHFIWILSLLSFMACSRKLSTLVLNDCKLEVFIVFPNDDVPPRKFKLRVEGEELILKKNLKRKITSNVFNLGDVGIYKVFIEGDGFVVKTIEIIVNRLDHKKTLEIEMFRPIDC